MSRIGKRPIPLPAGVTIAIEAERVTVNGPKGELTERIPRDIQVAHEGEEVVVKRPTDRGEHRALHGLTRTLVANMVQGVTAGFEKRLEIQGVGYRAQLRGRDLELALGYSHPIIFPLPEGVTVEIDRQVSITLRGADKAVLGQTAAKLRALREPDPYKGKGIRYSDEVVRRKVGKKAGAGAK